MTLTTLESLSLVRAFATGHDSFSPEEKAKIEVFAATRFLEALNLVKTARSTEEAYPATIALMNATNFMERVTVLLKTDCITQYIGRSYGSIQSATFHIKEGRIFALDVPKLV